MHIACAHHFPNSGPAIVQLDVQPGVKAVAPNAPKRKRQNWRSRGSDESGGEESGGEPLESSSSSSESEIDGDGEAKAADSDEEEKTK